VSAAFELGFDSIKLDGCGKVRRRERRGEKEKKRRAKKKARRAVLIACHPTPPIGRPLNRRSTTWTCGRGC
jgi:hypothetical protein